MSVPFEGHEPHMALQPSANQFAPHHAAQAAPGNGSLPPGAKETPDHNKRTSSVTKRSFLKKIGD